ncbi:hypothetical protein ACWGHU_24410 [Streptomyces xanthophaeus]
MSNGQNQGSGQTTPAPASPAPVPASTPQPDFVDTFTNPTMIGTDKKSDTPTLNKAVQPQGNTKTR